MSIRSPLEDRAGVVLADDWSDAARFTFGAPIEKVNVTAYNGDALAQFLRSDTGEWVPDAGVTYRKGLFKSTTGLRDTFKGGGPVGFRLKRAVAGVASTVDFTAYLDTSGGVNA